MHPGGKARWVELPAGQRVVPHPGLVPLCDLGAGGWIGNGWVMNAPNGDRLQAFCPHDRAHAHPGCLVAALADNAGKAYQALASGADDRGVDPGPKPGLKYINCLTDRSPPEITGVAKVNTPILDDDRRGAVSSAVKDQAVHPTALQGDAKATLTARLAYGAGKRTLGRSRIAGQARIGVTCDHA